MAGGSAVIGALRVVLGADTAAFESGLKKAQGQATSFAHSVEKIAAGIGLEHGIEKFVEAIVHSFKAAIEHADELGKAAQKVGLPVAELSKLKFAADLSDVSMESLTIGLGKLSKAMLDVARGGGNETKLAFDQLGISATNADGTLKSASAVLADVAGKFGGLTAPADPHWSRARSRGLSERVVGLLLYRAVTRLVFYIPANSEAHERPINLIARTAIVPTDQLPVIAAALVRPAGKNLPQ
jgi:hypothetical protein